MGNVVQLIKNKKDRSIESILREADLVGRTEAEKANPQMIMVRGYESEPFPICGFATIRVKNVRGKKLAKLKEFGFRKYSEGYGFHVGDYNQSYDLKKAYADAFTNILRENGFNAWSSARLD
jgi:hypothetical protein